MATAGEAKRGLERAFFAVPEVSWHGHEEIKAIMTVDVNLDGLVATGSIDNEIRIWRLNDSEKSPHGVDIIHVQSLTSHQGPINVLRFSPNGDMLASGSDDKSIILWFKKVRDDDASWGNPRMLRGHHMDVCDLAWAPDSTALVSGSVDNRVLVWDVAQLKMVAEFSEHTNWVQGVAWEPSGGGVLSVSGDRTCRVYVPQRAATAPLRKGAKGQQAQQAQQQAQQAQQTGKSGGNGSVADSLRQPWACHAVLGKRVLAPREPKLIAAAVMGGSASAACAHGGAAAAATATAGATVEPSAGARPASPPAPSLGLAVPPPQPPAEPAAAAAAGARLFLDDSARTYCRRPAWTPDGRFLLVPCGQFDKAAGAAATAGPSAPAPVSELGRTTHVFARGSYEVPIAHLPAGQQPTIAVRCCPLLFELRGEAAGGAAGGTPAEDVEACGAAPAPAAAQAERASAAAPADAAGDVAPAAVASAPWLPLPYRLVWAVLTTDAILVYDSQSALPLAVVQNTHFARLTDLAWSRDGRRLVVTSYDGYVTLLFFDGARLGTPLPAAQQPLLRARAEAAAAPAESAPAAEAAVVSLSAPAPSNGGAGAAEASPAQLPPSPRPCEAAAPATDAPATAASVLAPPALPAAAPAAAATAIAQTTAEAGAGEGAKKKKRITPMLVPS